VTRTHPDLLERLRLALCSVAEEGKPDNNALDADRIWQAVRGELPPAEVEEMADLASRSPDSAARGGSPQRCRASSMRRVMAQWFGSTGGVR